MKSFRPIRYYFTINPKRKQKKHFLPKLGRNAFYQSVIFWKDGQNSSVNNLRGLRSMRKIILKPCLVKKQ